MFSACCAGHLKLRRVLETEGVEACFNPSVAGKAACGVVSLMAGPLVNSSVHTTYFTAIAIQIHRAGMS